MATKKTSTTKKTASRKPAYQVTITFDGKEFQGTGETLQEALINTNPGHIKGKGTVTVSGKENGSVTVTANNLKKLFGSNTAARIHSKRISKLLA